MRHLLYILKGIEYLVLVAAAASAAALLLYLARSLVLEFYRVARILP